MTQVARKSSSRNISKTTTLFLVLFVYCLLDEALDSLVPLDPYKDCQDGYSLTETIGNNHREGSRDFPDHQTDLGGFEIALNDYPTASLRHRRSQLSIHVDEEYRNNDTPMEDDEPCRPSLIHSSAVSRDTSHKRWRGLSLFRTIGFASAIRLVRLDAPQTIHAGQPIRLRCIYETKGDRLQSLSWYKNGREFYRYQPFERRQPILAFNLTGFTIDTKFRNSTVTLVNTTADATGRYKCQVTGTSFQEVNMETNINVVTATSASSPVLYRHLDKLCLIVLSFITMFITSSPIS